MVAYQVVRDRRVGATGYRIRKITVIAETAYGFSIRGPVALHPTHKTTFRLLRDAKARMEVLNAQRTHDVT